MGLVATPKAPDSRQSAHPLTGHPPLPIVPAMYGLNQICGICREIIR
jgi:hypothetical protein